MADTTAHRTNVLFCRRTSHSSVDFLDIFEQAIFRCDVCGRPIPESRRQRRPDGGGVCSYLCQRIDQRARVYGISGRLYRSMVEGQRGLCAICGFPLVDGEGEWKLQIDHDHKTGRVRGILCGRCNLGLGFFQDDPERLNRAAEYIRHSRDEAVPRTDVDVTDGQ